MPNAGSVELDLVAVGKDQVSAMLRTLEANVRKTAQEMGQAGTAAKGFGDKVDDVKKSIAPMNKLKETFNQVRENAFFVVGAVAGVVVGLGKLADAFSSNAQAISAWEAEQGKVKDHLAKTSELIEDIAKQLGEPVRSELEKTADKTLDRWEANKDAIEKANLALDALRENQAAIGNAVGTWAPEYHRLANEIAKTETQRTELMREQGKLIEQNTKLLAEQARVAGLGFRADVTGAAGQPFFLRWPAANAPGGGGGGGGGRGGGSRRNRDPGRDGLSFDQLNPVMGSDRTQGQLDALPIFSEDVGGIFDVGKGGPADALDQMYKSSERLGDSLRSLSDAVGDLGSAKFPELFDALTEIQDITQKVTDGKMDLTDALVAGSSAIVANAAKAIGGVRAEAAVRAAYELGMGFATLAEPTISAGHFTAAALLGAIAGGAGAKGGGGGGGTRSGSSSGSGGGYGGPTTIINNFSTLVTDPHQVRRATAQVERSTRGTGERRGG